MSDEDRFWSKVQKTDTCWQWIGGSTRGDSGKSPLSYGSFTTGTHKAQKNWAAHRYSYFITHGEIPEGLMIRHKCDNSLCVNPSHLETGTHKDNMRDMAERKRVNAKGERNSQAKLNEEQVREIKRRLLAGDDCHTLGAEFNVVFTNIKNIKYGYRWAHVTI